MIESRSMPQPPERRVDDVPFYDGRPIEIRGWQWMLVMLAVGLGFMVLVAPFAMFAGPMGQFVLAVLFPAIPLAALASVAGRHWTAIFRPLRGADLLRMVGYGALNIVATFVVGAIVWRVRGAHANPVFARLSELSPGQHAAFFAKTLPQLFGEEVLTILPLLAVMALLHGKLGMRRRPALLAAWLASSLLFALVHLPTYGWDVVQCVAIIGTARLILTSAYLATRNILVSTGAHVFNDWVLLGVAIALNAPPAR